MRALIMSVVVLTAACAASAGGERSASSRDVLTLEEIQGSSRTEAEGLIRALRPHWFRVRGRVNFSGAIPIMVYVNGVRMGGIEVLPSISTDVIEEIRYYGASEAQTRFGMNNLQGAIAIRTR